MYSMLGADIQRNEDTKKSNFWGLKRILSVVCFKVECNRSIFDTYVFDSSVFSNIIINQGKREVLYILLYRKWFTTFIIVHTDYRLSSVQNHLKIWGYIYTIGEKYHFICQRIIIKDLLRKVGKLIEKEQLYFSNWNSNRLISISFLTSRSRSSKSDLYSRVGTLECNR